MDRRNKMESMAMGRLITEMSIPMMLSLLIQSLYNIVDSAFISRLSEDALAATSFAYPVQMLMIAVGVGTAVGLNAVLSKALGAKKKDEANMIAATGAALSVISGIVFMVIGLLFSKSIAAVFASDGNIAEECGEYLWICMVFSIGNMVSMMYQRLMQATGRTVLSMVILICGAVTNIVLDPIMIFGQLGCPAMGVKGAAIATVIGQWVSMCVGFILQRFFNRDVKVSFRSFRFNAAYIKGIYRVGFPTIITQAMQSMMVTCVNAILQPFSTTAVAFFGVYYKLQSFLFMPMNGLGQADIPIIGYNYGAKNPDRIKKAMKLTYPAAAVIALIGTAAFMILPEQLLGIFAASDAMLKVGVPALRIIAPTFILASVTTISGYCASGLQDGITNMAGAVIRQFIPLIPCVWILAKTGGIGTVWYAFWISEIPAMIFGMLRIRSLMKKRVLTMENGG